MSVLRDTLSLLTTPPGGMVYYLVLLFSIWAVVGLALSRWSRGERRGIVPRFLVAGGILSLGHLILFLLALVDRATGTGTVGYLVRLGPPLERFLGALSAVLICWAVAIPLRQRTFGRVFLTVGILLAAGFYVLASMEWASTLQINPQVRYNLTWQRWAWETSQLALLLGMMAYALAVAVPERGTVAVLLAVLAGGHLLQATVPMADEIAHLPGWVRLANLLAFPLFAVIAFRSIISRFDAQTINLQSVNQETLTQITGLMDLLDTQLKVSGSLELDTILRTAVRSVSQALQTDLCTILLLDPEDEAWATMPILYRVPDMVHKEERVQLAEYPALQHALSRTRAVVFEPGDDEQARDVYRLMDSQADGPLIIQPMSYDAELVGLLLVAQPGQSAPFAQVQLRKCETLARYVSLAVHNAREYARMRDEIETLRTDSRVLERELSRTRAGLENRLREAKDEIAVHLQRLYETEQALQRAQEDAQGLRAQLAEVGQAASDTGGAVLSEASEGGAAVETDRPEVALLNKRVATLETAREQLERQVETLEQERKQLRSQLSRAEVTYNNLRARLRKVEAGGESKAGSEQGMVPLRALPMGIVVCDIKGQIVDVNPAAARMLGIEEGEAQGREAALLWPDEEWRSAVQAVTVAGGTQARAEETISLQRPTQQMQVLLSPLLVKGEHVGALLVLQEATGEDERSRARDEFLSSLSQELRTPMTSIVGYTELLMNESVGKLDDTQRRFLHRVQANIERMGALLNDLMGITAIDSGKLDIELEPVNVERALERALQNARFRLAERELNTHLEIGQVESIYLDPDCFQQIIDNLLNNASKSSETGTTIHIAAQGEPDESGQSYLHFSISDTGGGIAPEDRPRVFERFYRADSALISGLGETGVGLAIVKEMVEAHGGRVWIETELGQGTTFHVMLPYGLEEMMDAEDSNLTLLQRSSGDNGNG